jgi:hypothetical protein
MVACSGPRHLLHIPRWRFLVGCGAILPPSPGNIIYPRARASNVRTLRLGLPLLQNCCKIDLAAALEHLSVSAGRAGRWQEGANLRTAVNLRSLMAMFEALEVLERQVFDAPNLADTDANATRQGRGLRYVRARRLRHGPSWTRRGFGNTSTLIRQNPPSSCTVCARTCYLPALTRSTHRVVLVSPAPDNALILHI